MSFFFFPRPGVMMNQLSVRFTLVLATLVMTSQLSVAQRPFYLLPDLHPGYDQLISMRPSGMETSGSNAAPNVGGMAWLPDGRLFIASMSSNSAGGPNANRLGDSLVYIFSGIPDATSNATVEVAQVSTGYQMPSGAVAVGDTIFVLDNEEGLTRLVQDGDTWTKSTVHNGALGRSPGVTVQNANRTWTGGLVYHEGYLYAAVGMGLIPGGTSFGFTGTEEEDLYRGKGSIWKISTDGAVVDTFAGGVRNPVSMAVGPDEQIFYTDNEGSFMPASAMFHVTEGAFFGHMKTPFDDRMRTPPTIIFPYGSNPTGGTVTNPTVARVATDMLTLRTGRYIGQMLVGTNHTTGINRVFLEKILDPASGTYMYQGALFPFSQGMGVGSGSGGAAAIPGVLEDFRTNVNRMSYGPDGQIYVGGGNSPGAATNGSHGFVGGLQYGLARMVPNNDPVFEMKAIRSMGPTEMEIEFTEPVVSVATGNFTVRPLGWSVERCGPPISQSAWIVSRRVRRSNGTPGQSVSPRRKSIGAAERVHVPLASTRPGRTDVRAAGRGRRRRVGAGLRDLRRGRRALGGAIRSEARPRLATPGHDGRGRRRRRQPPVRAGVR
jgi:cytochrome c